MDLGISGPVKEGETKIEKRKMCRSPDVLLLEQLVSRQRRHNILNVAENIEKAEALVRQAAAEGAQVILLPELFERQYFCQERRYDYYQFATPVMENPAVRYFQRVCASLGVVIPVSFYERDVNRLFNSVAMIDADGSILGVYRKTHIPDDHFYQEKFYAGL